MGGREEKRKESDWGRAGKSERVERERAGESEREESESWEWDTRCWEREADGRIESGRGGERKIERGGGGGPSRAHP